MRGKQRSIYDEIILFLNSFKDELNLFDNEEKTPLINLLKSSKPYQGNFIPQANSSMAVLKVKLLNLLLTSI